MKIFTKKVGPLGDRFVTGRTALSPTAEHAQPVPTGPLFSRGVAVSVLPPDYQRRLLAGEQISATEFSSLDISVVR